MLQKRLNLSADQTAQIKAILADGRAKMEALRSGDSGAPSADRRAEGMALMKEENGKIEAVLTPDQKSRYEEMMARQRERMQGRGPGGGDGGAPPPPPPPPPQQ
jgi:Spy/CpxP family protein refolding chaperone